MLRANLLDVDYDLDFILRFCPIVVGVGGIVDGTEVLRYLAAWYSLPSVYTWYRVTWYRVRTAGRARTARTWRSGRRSTGGPGRRPGAGPGFEGWGIILP